MTEVPVPRRYLGPTTNCPWSSEPFPRCWWRSRAEMPTPVNPSLFWMFGRGFRGDAYAIDGNHLRWAFDPRLGFPRFAFCVEMRDSVAGEQPPADSEPQRPNLQAPPGTQPQTLIELELPELVAYRRGPAAHLTRSVAGVALSGQSTHYPLPGPGLTCLLDKASAGGALTGRFGDG